MKKQPATYQSLLLEYNKTFAKWSRAKGVKKEAYGLEMERLNEKMIEAEKNVPTNTKGGGNYKIS